MSGGDGLPVVPDGEIAPGDRIPHIAYTGGEVQ